MENKTDFEGMAKAILVCNMMGGESYALVNDVNEYYNMLESLLDDIKQGKGESSNYLYFAFVSLASATLEYSLNFMLSAHCFLKYHFPKYENHLQTFLNISFAQKIEITSEIVSEGEFAIKQRDPTLQCLKELVNKRNNLMHNSNAVKVQKFDFPNTGARIIDGGIFIPIDNLNADGSLDITFSSKDNVITSLTSNWCVRIGMAILKYRDCIVTPYLTQSGLKENEMLESCKHPFTNISYDG